MRNVTPVAILVFAAITAAISAANSAAISAAISASGEAPKSCEVLKSEIAAKLEAKGVKAYTLEVVAKDKATEGTVVGSCEGGAKKITYSKTAAPPAASAPKSSKPKK